MMDETKVVPCRLCLNVITAEDSEELDAVEQNIMEELIPELNLDITYDPKICRICNKTMIASYQFVNKARDILLCNHVKTETHSLEGSEKICDFCRSSIDDSFLAEFNRQKEHFSDILEKCIPEWVSVCDKKTVPCRKCLESFKTQFSFISTCLNTEEKIKQYCSTQGTNSEGKINLNEALQLILSSKTKPLVAHFTATNKNEDRNEDCDVVVKAEPGEIKSEKYEREPVERPCSSKTGLTVALNSEIKASATHLTPFIKKEEQNEEYTFILKTEDLEIKSEVCDEEDIEKPCSSKTFQGEILMRGTQSISLGETSNQAQQSTIQYILAAGNTSLQPTTSLKAPAQRKRASTAQIETAAEKQQKTTVRQNVTASDAPGKRSIGIQVDTGDLIKKCSIGIQVASWEVNTRTIGVNATPSTSSKQVVRRPTVLNTGTTTGVKSKEKRGTCRPIILRRSRK